MMEHPKSQETNERVDSWKGIAAHFGRDERTVKRWEKERLLPVHRVPGHRGGVFAFTQELDAWLRSSSGERETSVQGPSDRAFAEPSAPSGMAPEVAPSAAHAVSKPAQSKAPGLRIKGGFVAAAALVAAGLLSGVLLSGHRRTAKPVEAKTPDPFATSIPEVRENYLMGRYYWNRRTGGDLNRAIDAFTQALIRDPGYAPAYAGLALSYDLLPEYGSTPGSEAYPRAIAAAQKAIQLAPSCPDAHRALAFARFYWDWDVAQAEAEYKRAIELDPNAAESHHWYATALLTLNRLDQSRAEIEEARRLEPGSRSIIADEAFIAYAAGDVEDSLSKLEGVQRSEPDFVMAPRYLATAFFQLREYPRFIDEKKRAALISGNTDEAAVADAAERGWAAGKEHGMLMAMRATQTRLFSEGKSTGYDLALTCALLGQKQEAITYLQAAYKAHDLLLMTLLNGSMDPMLKGYPPFEQMKQQVADRMHRSVYAQTEPSTGDRRAVFAL